MGVFSRTNPTAAFNYVISQIASGDVTASTQALVQFEKVIRNKNHKEVSKHIDQVRIVFLVSLTTEGFALLIVSVLKQLIC